MQTETTDAEQTPPKRLGILGGGQLARMLLQAAVAAELPVELRVLTPSARDPAGRLCGELLSLESLVLGDPRDPEALRAFLGEVDLACFESEFQPASELEAAATGLSVRFVPSLEALATTQDKLAQKALYQALEIPTAPWLRLPAELTEAKESSAWLRAQEAELGPDPVLKWACLGYDGKGTFFGAARAAEDAAIAERLGAFFLAAAERKTAVFAERRIDFVRELALVVSHGVDGQLAAYPLVISEQEEGICKRVVGPATALGVAPALEAQARLYAERIAVGLPLHGTFALELFEADDGQLYVNEMAPRVHNSGHVTLDSAHCSQFENHLRAIMGLPLGRTEACTPLFAMWNLLADRACPWPPPPEPLLGNASKRLTIHWYQKSESRPGRKMGHISGLAASAHELEEVLRYLAETDEGWLRRVVRVVEERAATATEQGEERA